MQRDEESTPRCHPFSEAPSGASLKVPQTRLRVGLARSSRVSFAGPPFAARSQLCAPLCGRRHPGTLPVSSPIVCICTQTKETVYTQRDFTRFCLFYNSKL